MHDIPSESLELSAQHFNSIEEIRKSAEHAPTPHQRIVEQIIVAVGRPALFYGLLLLAVLWIMLNLGLGKGAFDPLPFSLLQLILTGFAAFIAALVLIAENRISRSEREREYLDLQINLLSEHKITKVIALLEELRRDLPMVHDREDLEAESLSNAINPKAVVDQLRERDGQAPLPESLG